MDESTWGHGWYCAVCDGRLLHKPFNKEEQSTLIMDTSQCYPLCYVHQPKVHVGPVGFKIQESLEVVACCI
jgi:hypothetical protein